MDGNIRVVVWTGVALKGNGSRFPASDFCFCGALFAAARPRKFKPGFGALERLAGLEAFGLARRSCFRSVFRGSCGLYGCPENDAPWPGATARTAWLGHDGPYLAIDLMVRSEASAASDLFQRVLLAGLRDRARF